MSFILLRRPCLWSVFFMFACQGIGSRRSNQSSSVGFNTIDLIFARIPQVPPRHQRTIQRLVLPCHQARSPHAIYHNIYTKPSHPSALQNSLLLGLRERQFIFSNKDVRKCFKNANKNNTAISFSSYGKRHSLLLGDPS
jgi:hypothetical protein